MRSDARGFFGVVLSLLIAVLLGLLVAHLRDETARRDRPVNVPLAEAR